MVDWDTPSSYSLTETSKKQPKVVRTNFVEALENSQRFTPNKQVPNQEKAIFKMAGKFCDIFTHLCTTPFPVQW